MQLYVNMGFIYLIFFPRKNNGLSWIPSIEKFCKNSYNKLTKIITVVIFI
jgi:hypothetical protein